MKDLLMKDFNVYIAEHEKQRMDDMQVAMGQALMFGNDPGCSTCGSMMLVKSELDMCGECAMKAAEIYKTIHNLKFLE